MNELAKKLNITDTLEWSKITSTVLKNNHGNGMLQKYNGSTSKLLLAVNPHFYQACRDLVLRIVGDLKLSKVEDILHAPMEYHAKCERHYISDTLKRVLHGYNIIPKCHFIHVRVEQLRISYFCEAKATLWLLKNNWFAVVQLEPFNSRFHLFTLSVVFVNSFPELKFHLPERPKHQGYWKDIKNQKEFLENFAAKYSIFHLSFCLLFYTLMIQKTGIQSLMYR